MGGTLATSRERRPGMPVGSRSLWEVSSCRTTTQATAVGLAGSSEAGRLFLDRAARARPGFILHDPDVSAVARICERLDGIPLALELAAARARLMSVHAIAAGLSDRFHLLVGGGRAAPSRQKHSWPRSNGAARC